MNDYVTLAKSAVEIFVKKGKVPKVRAGCAICDDAEFKGMRLCRELASESTGVFVSLYAGENELRGCMGTLSASCDTLAEEIIRNSVNACAKDWRFEPVTEAELPKLKIRVDILSAAVPAAISDLNPSRFGIIVNKGCRQGYVFPDEKKVTDVQSQINLACSNAGIDIAENPEIRRFEVTSYTEL